MSTPEFHHFQQALLGRYSLERELGRGGMGTVYLARDVRLERPVAIKLLHPELAARPDSRARFMAEARTAARLSHPHIVSVYSVEATASFVFFIMALVDGETLGARVRRRGPLPPEQAEQVLRETAYALEYAHASGIIHRDLTLENILIERGTDRALLADFGLATARESIEQGPVFGTPGFLAPEIIRGEDATPRTDLYALGCVAFAALTGEPVFEAETQAQLLAKHLVQAVPSCATRARGISRRLSHAVDQLLAKDPEDRPADAAAFLALLERAPEPIAVAPVLREWFTRWERIRPIYALATPILALQTWLLIYGYLYSSNELFLAAAGITTALTLTAVPVASHVLFEAFSLRRLRRSGMGVADIRAAYPHWQEELTREQAREGLPPLPGRVVLDLTVIGALVLLITFVFVFPRIDAWYDWAGEASYVKSTILEMSSTAYLAVMTGVGIGFAAPGFRVKPGGRFRRLIERFWQSRLAGVITRLSAMGQRQHLAAGSTLHRNTEMVLGLAVDDLWHNLPAETKEGLGDVPALAHTLQASAVELRHLIDRIRKSERQLGASDAEALQLAAAREPLEVRHKETVAALERVRLQLLKLIATRQHTVELTQQLDAARALELAVVRDLAAQDELRQLLGRAQTRERALPASPTPAAA